MKNESFMWDLMGLYGDEWGFNEQTWGQLFRNDPTLESVDILLAGKSPTSEWMFLSLGSSSN